MKFKVYYDDVDGVLHPVWALLESNFEDDFVYYSLNAPFERFFPEDFYDDMQSITVTQGDLVRCPVENFSFGISIPMLKRYLQKNHQDPNLVYDVEFFIVRFDDLEELMQFNVRGIFRSEVE